MVVAAGARIPLGCRMVVVMGHSIDVVVFVVEVLLVDYLAAILVVVFDHDRGPEVVVALVVGLAEPAQRPVGHAVSSRHSFYCS